MGQNNKRHQLDTSKDAAAIAHASGRETRARTRE
jgi:hypothetical protein